MLGPLGAAPAFLGYASPIYGLAAAAAGAYFIWLNWLVVKYAGADNCAAEKRLFKYSIYYLFGIFAALLVDGIVQAVIG